MFPMHKWETFVFRNTNGKHLCCVCACAVCRSEHAIWKFVGLQICGSMGSNACRHAWAFGRLCVQVDFQGHVHTVCTQTCRYANFFLPWKCDHERHSYEKCQYEEFERRVKQMM